jgi:hypothetical protein
MALGNRAGLNPALAGRSFNLFLRIPADPFRVFREPDPRGQFLARLAGIALSLFSRKPSTRLAVAPVRRGDRLAGRKRGRLDETNSRGTIGPHEQEQAPRANYRSAEKGDRG